MTKDILYSKLEAFISKGYLRENYTSEKFTAFLFLDTAYVGFCHDGNEEENAEVPKAVFLTEHEVETVKRSGAYAVIENAKNKDELCITFTDKLLEKCTSSLGRSKLKRMMKKLYCPGKDNWENFDSVPTGFSERIGTFALSLALAGRSENIKGYRKNIKKVKTLVTVMLVCTALFLGGVMTADWRKQFDPDRVSAAFDKNASEYAYSYIEADVFASFATLSPKVLNDENAYIENYHGEYYLWGNTKTGDFGILRFAGLTDEEGIVGDTDEPTVLEESVILYGDSLNLPTVISGMCERAQQKEEEESQSSSDNTVNGTELRLPDIGADFEFPLFDIHDSLIIDTSKSALRFFEEKGISVDSAEALGAKYIETTVKPVTVKSALNKTVDIVMFLALTVMLIVIVIAVIFAHKADKFRDALVRTNTGICAALKRFLPVVTKSNGIYIRSEGFMLWVSELCGKDFEPFECTMSIPLAGAAPCVALFEDGDDTREFSDMRNFENVYKTREYVLQTEGDESFDGKYFLASVRLSLISELNAPVAQIDGFISDTPDEREMTRDDIGYRMEGHFLALGKSRGEAVYTKVQGQDLVAKGLKYPGYTTPVNVRLIGVCPKCGKSFAFHAYAVYMTQEDVAYSDDGMDCCSISEYEIDKKRWSYTADGKTFRYYNSFNCPHCGTPYIDYKKHPEMKQFGVSACVHMGRELYRSK